jgi:cytochrome c-type biogenesis protein
VPLCRRGETKRAIALALLFGGGLTITLSLWGVVIAAVGTFLGFREIARYLSIAGGVVAYALGLWTLALVHFPLPSGSGRLPQALTKRSEYLGAFLLGLLFGNMGLCCPDPVFLSMVPFIATRGDIANGGIMAASYGLGRATPLVGLVVLSNAGIDALGLIARHKRSFDRVIGWGLVAIGTVMISGYSGLSHDRLAAVLMMALPVLAYHVRIRSSVQRAVVWLLITSAGTLGGLQAMYWTLVNLP